MRARRASVALWVAACAGLVHAAWSAYWAVGGRFLLDTVGAWAVELGRIDPLRSGIVLGAIAVVKAVAALLPVAIVRNRLPAVRWWRAVCWAGGAFLVVYGGLNVVVSSAVLVGVLRPADGYDAAAMIGHALLWDPLFVVWGAALPVALAASRSAPRRRMAA